jgi:hypothetical protein
MSCCVMSRLRNCGVWLAFRVEMSDLVLWVMYVG